MTDVVQEHPYLSAACLHELHSHCSGLCRFCESRCSCICHRETDPGPEPPPIAALDVVELVEGRPRELVDTAGRRVVEPSRDVQRRLPVEP